MGKIKLKDMSWASYVFRSGAMGAVGGAMMASEAGGGLLGIAPAAAGVVIGMGVSPVVAAISYGAVSVLSPNPQDPKLSDIPDIVGGSALGGGYLLGYPFYEAGKVVFGVIGGIGGGFAGIGAGLATLPAFLAWKAMHRNRNNVPDTTREFSPELQRYLVSEASNNKKRITQMLFDHEYMFPQDAEYLRSEVQLDEWLQAKLGLERYHVLKAAMLCPFSKDIPDCPVILTSTTGDEMMCSFEKVEQNTESTLWSNGQYRNPFTNEIADKGSIRPAHGTQSIINRLLNRLNQFREEKELSFAQNNQEREKAHDNAIRRSLTLHTKDDSNQYRMNRALGDSGSIEDFIHFIQRKPELANHIAPAKHYDDLLKLPLLPDLAMYYGDTLCAYPGNHISHIAVHAPIAYDVQNTIEQLINLATELKPEFANRRRAGCSIQ